MTSTVADPGRTSGVRHWSALGLLCTAFFVDVLASTAVFTAGPAIAASLDLSPVGLQWTFTAYALPAASLLLLGGRLSDRFGARSLLVVGLVLLVVASAVCGAATTGGVLLAGRVVQGVSAALTMPAALALVITTFAEPAERNRALAVWAAVGGIGATAGLVLGGLVTDGVGWRWVFWATIPVGLVGIALAPVLLRRSRRRPVGLDISGAALVTVGLAALVYGVSRVATVGWRHAETLGPMVLGVVLCGAFVVVEGRSADPLVPLRLFASRSLVAGNVALVVAGMCVDGLLFTVTTLTQTGLGWSAWDFAALASLMTVVSSAASWNAQRRIGVVGTRGVAASGMGLLALTGLTMAASTGGTQPAYLLAVGMLLFGAGMGGAFVAGSVAALSDVGEADSGIAAALQNVSFGVGTTLGVAVLATVAAATDDYGVAFVAGAALATLGLVAVLVLMPRATSRR
jgi:MFS family permease